MPSIQQLAANLTPAEVAILFGLLSVAIIAVVLPYASKQHRARDFASRQAELKRLQDL